MQLKNKLIILTVLFVLLLIPNKTISKYKSIVEQNGTANIAKPIIIFEEKSEPISMLVNKTLFPLEYEFAIKNYRDEKVNEVDFYYNIEVKNTSEKFPIKYTLIDMDTGKRLLLENNKTENFKISKSIAEQKNFKLILEWNKSEGEMAVETNLEIKMNVIQQKLGD